MVALNILFTLLLVVVLTYLIDRGGPKRLAFAVALFVLGGAFVEYLWMGVLCCLAAWLFCRETSPSRLSLWILATLSLTLINGNTRALAAIPIVRSQRSFYSGRNMTLQNLVGISLDRIAPAKETVKRLLESAARQEGRAGLAAASPDPT